MSNPTPEKCQEKLTELLQKLEQESTSSGQSLRDWSECIVSMAEEMEERRDLILDEVGDEEEEDQDDSLADEEDEE